jgi:hypothetical protein
MCSEFQLNNTTVSFKQIIFTSKQGAVTLGRRYTGILK